MIKLQSKLESTESRVKIETKHEEIFGDSQIQINPSSGPENHTNCLWPKEINYLCVDPYLNSLKGFAQELITSSQGERA
jgi:hypothetical protein